MITNYFCHTYIKKAAEDKLKRYGEGDGYMPKDSQPDNKKARMVKCKGQTPITKENMNQNKNAKKKSVKNKDV